MKLVVSALRALGVRAARCSPVFVVAVAATFSTTASLAQNAAQAAPAGAVDLPQVVVIASREPLPRDQVTADVVVIDSDRIRASAADSVEDLLRREAGVQISRNGGPGQSAGVLIRGASASGTLVLIDGVRVGSATLGLVAMNSIALAQIERIEVLRGPASSLYGADALGGVIRITTLRGAGPLNFSARAAVGEYNSREGDVSLSGSSDRFDYAASVSHERSDGVSALRPNDQFGAYNPDRDGYNRRTAQVSLGHTLVPGHRVSFSLVDARLRSRYDGAVYDANYNPDASGDFRNRLDTQVASFTYDGVWSPVWTSRVQLAHSEDDERTGALVPEHNLTRRDQYTLQNAFTLATGHQLVAVLERLEESAKASTLTSDRSRHNDAVALGYSGRLGSHLLSADVRHDDSSVYGGKTTGRLGWGYELGHGLTARALAGTTFRAPAFNDLYYSDAYGPYGVPTIRPERGRSVEVGLDWRSGDSVISTTLFRNRVRDLIGYEADSSLCPDASYYGGCASNTGKAKLEGISLSAAHRVGALSLRATADVLSARDEVTDARLSRRARHQETLNAEYRIDAWSFGSTLLVVGDRLDGSKHLGSYSTIDLQARWRFASQWQLEAKVLNVADRDIEPARDTRALGRQAWLALRYSGVGL